MKLRVKYLSVLYTYIIHVANAKTKYEMKEKLRTYI